VGTAGERWAKVVTDTMLAAPGHGHDYLTGNRQHAPASNTIVHAQRNPSEVKGRSEGNEDNA
jgi:hypothetical protein